MGLPEGEVGSVGEEIDVAEVALAAADFHDAATSGVEVMEVVLGVKEGNGVRGAAGGAGEEDGAELILRASFGSGAAMKESLENQGGFMAECGFVGDKDKVALLLTGHGEVGFAGERDASPVVPSGEVFRVDVVLAEQAAIMGTEGEDAGAQVVAEAAELPVLHFILRRSVPSRGGGEEFHGELSWGLVGSDELGFGRRGG